MSDGFAATAGKAARPGSWWLRRLADACLLMGSTLYLALTLATFAVYVLGAAVFAEPGVYRGLLTPTALVFGLVVP